MEPLDFRMLAVCSVRATTSPALMTSTSPMASYLTAGTRWSYELLRARGNTIEGGTTEILKNIVAERVLGLPRMR